MLKIVDIMLRDNVKARVLQSDGRYRKKELAPGEPLVNSQEYFIATARERWQRNNLPPNLSRKRIMHWDVSFGCWQTNLNSPQKGGGALAPSFYLHSRLH